MFKIMQSYSPGIKQYLRNFNTNPIIKCIKQQYHSYKKPNILKVQCPKEVNNSLKVFFLSGCGLGLGVTAHVFAGHAFASCESVNRLKGSSIHKNEDLHFDWKKFWSYLKPHLLQLIAAIVAALCVAFLNIKIPQLLGSVINVVTNHASEEGGEHIEIKDGIMSFTAAMKGPSVNLLLMYGAQSAFTFLYIFLLSGIGEKMAAHIRHDLFTSIIKQDISFFDNHKTGELVNRLTSDVQELKSSFKQCVSQGLRSAAQLIGGSISLYLISPTLTCVALVFIPTMIVIGSYIGAILRQMSRQAQAQLELSTAVGDEAIGNIRTVRAFAMEDTEASLFYKEANKARIMNENLGFGIAIFQAGTNLFLNGIVLATLYMGGTLLIDKQLSPGDLMAFLVASQTVQRSLAQGSLLLGSVVRGISAGSRVFEYLNLKEQVPLIGGMAIPRDKLKGTVSFNNVSFAYPSRPENLILKDFNLYIPPGKTVAIVGVSGSGKSTIANLLERFYEPISGEIFLDGKAISSLCPHWMRGTVLGYIDQNPTLFATTVMENIRYGNPLASDEEVMRAAKQANADGFIRGFHDGYSTVVGERGTALSGGQKQRIAIARALLKDPKILVLDEATSALDTESEAIVQSAIEDASRGRTVIVIAHRLSTIRKADLIVVMKNGVIVEVGNHESLKNKKGHYWNLVRTQDYVQDKKVAVEHFRSKG